MARPPIANPSSGSSGPTRDDQPAILYSSIVFLFVIAIFWTLPIIRVVINPLKLYTIGWHEFCHLALAVLTGGSIVSISIDPNLGGCCEIEGGHPPTILAAGYLGSVLWGCTLMLGGWNLLVAKILSFFIAIGLLLPLGLVRDKLTIFLTLIYEGLLIGFWFIDHGSPLRWYCLFLGIMNVFYVICRLFIPCSICGRVRFPLTRFLAAGDISDERFLKKRNSSDITQFTLLYPDTTSSVWILLWLIIAAGAAVGFSVLGHTVWELDSAQMYEQAARFLPT